MADPIIDPKTADPATPAPDLAKENADLKARLADLEKRAAPPAPAPDLIEKARLERDAKEKDTGKNKRLEDSIRFSMGSQEFLKANERLLPKEVGEIFKAADREIYADATEKADAIKSNLIQSFFQVQANADLLTAGQKAILDDYLKLTKNGKQEKAQEIYGMIFEPAFEMLKRTKKAEALSGGFSGGSDEDEAYKQKLISRAKKHYGLEKR